MTRSGVPFGVQEATFCRWTLVTAAVDIPTLFRRNRDFRYLFGARLISLFGDWFNLLDFSYRSNGWARGLPPAWDNEGNWPVAGPLLADPKLRPGENEILAAARNLREMLRIRRETGLFSLPAARDVIRRVEFHNTGPGQAPGLIVMSVRGERHVEAVVLFNAATTGQAFPLDPGGQFRLHPVQMESHDPVVRKSGFDGEKGVFHVPPRTTAVFVRQ